MSVLVAVYIWFFSIATPFFEQFTNPIGTQLYSSVLLSNLDEFNRQNLIDFMEKSLAELQQ
jgi:hypothetical protein